MYSESQKLYRHAAARNLMSARGFVSNPIWCGYLLGLAKGESFSANDDKTHAQVDEVITALWDRSERKRYPCLNATK